MTGVGNIFRVGEKAMAAPVTGTEGAVWVAIQHVPGATAARKMGEEAARV